MLPYDEIETKYDLKKITINDECIYPLVRLNLIGNPNSAYLKNKKGGARYKLVRALRNHDFKSRINIQTDISVLFIENDTYQYFDGYDINKFTEAIKSTLTCDGHKYFSLFTGIKKFDNLKRAQTYTISSQLWLQRLKARVQYKFKKYDISDETEKLCQEYGKQFNRLHLRHIKQTYEQFSVIRAYFKKIFKTSRPKILVLVNYYSLVHQCAIYAARNLNIPVIEIQHGVQGEGHHAYSTWHQFETLPFQFFPTIFWTWTETEQKYLNQFLNDSEHCEAQAFGHPFIHLTQKGPLEQKDKDIVLITLQPFSDLKKYDQLITAIQSLPNLKFEIRAHPSTLSSDSIDEVSDYFSSIISKDSLLKSSKVPLTQQLNKTRVHITFSSSVCLEAAAYGIPSIVINRNEIQHYRNLKEQQMVVGAESSTEIKKAIEDLFQSELQKGNITQNSHFVAQGVEKIKMLLER